MALAISLSCTGSLFVSQAKYTKYADLCSSRYLLLAVEDPKSKSAISDLMISLFNGATGATIKNTHIDGYHLSKCHHARAFYTI